MSASHKQLAARKYHLRHEAMPPGSGNVLDSVECSWDDEALAVRYVGTKLQSGERPAHLPIICDLGNRIALDRDDLNFDFGQGGQGLARRPSASKWPDHHLAV